MWTWIALALAFVVIVILVDEFSSPPEVWRKANRRVKRKSVRDGMD